MARLMGMVPEDEREGCLLVVNWTSRTPDSHLTPGLHIGGMKSKDVPPEYIVESHGVRVAYNFDEVQASKFDGCVLDYVEGTLVFIDER